MLDYHLHLWPHSEHETPLRLEQLADVLRPRTGGGRDGAGRHRAPLPLPPGRRSARWLLGRPGVPAVLAESMAEYWKFHATRRPGCLRASAPWRRRRPASPSSSASRSITTRGAWTQVADLLHGYPLRRPLGFGALAGCVALRRPVRPGVDGGVVGPGRRRVLGGVHEGNGGTGRVGGLRRPRPSRPHQGGRPRAGRPRRMVGPHCRGGRDRRAWLRRCPRRAGASRLPSSTPQLGLLERFVARGVPLTTASDAHRLEHVADRADELRAVLAAAGAGTLQGYSRRRPYVVPVSAGSRAAAHRGEI